jgi:hypothetical protein
MAGNWGKSYILKVDLTPIGFPSLPKTNSKSQARSAGRNFANQTLQMGLLVESGERKEAKQEEINLRKHGKSPSAQP